MLKLFLVALILLSCSTQNSKDIELDNRISRYLDVLVENRDFSGVVLIAKKDEILTSYVNGFSDLSQKKRHNLNSKFGIASLTKTFTSAAILKLKRDGRLSLTDKVSKYLTEFTYGDKITLLNLLRHESGLSNLKENDYGLGVLSTSSVIKEIGKKDLQFEPGTNGRYSNAGFSVLARVVEVVSQLSFEDYLRINFFEPLEMNNSGDSRIDKDALTQGYFPAPPPSLIDPLDSVNYSLSFGSGSLHSSAIDLWKWGKSINNKKFIDIFSENYPYGWGRDSIAGEFCLNQTGMHRGYVSSLFLFPDQETVIVLLSNIQHGFWANWTKDIASLYFEPEKTINYPVKRHIFSNTLTAAKLENLKGVYDQISGNRTFQLKSIQDNLFISFYGESEAHYLAPISENKYDLRSFTGMITLTENDTMQWTYPVEWGGNSDLFKKRE